MGFYDRHILPPMLNACMGMKQLREEREKIVPKASGDVVEIGIGSGLNLPHYGPDVESVTGVDPSIELQKRARERASQAVFPVYFKSISGESLPLDDESFDCAVITWTLCTIPDPGKALAEVRRVLKPGGKLFFIEHGHSPDESVARWQERINGFWPKITGGCNVNRHMDTLIAGGGFTFEEMETGYIKGPRPMSYMYRGVAQRG